MTLDRRALHMRLEEMKSGLERDEALGEEDTAPVELDQTSVGRLSRMDAIQVQAMAIAKRERRRTELERVRSALARIDSEEFGYCAVCGEEIGEKRLAANPAVTRCIGCAE